MMGPRISNDMEPLASRAGRELQHALAGLDQPERLAGNLLDVVRIVTQAVDGDGQALGLGAERADLALQALDLVLHVPDAPEALAAIAEEQEGGHAHAEHAERAA